MKLENDHFFLVEFFFMLPKITRDLIRYLLFNEKKRRAGEYTEVFPSKKRMCKFAGCCYKTIQRFNKLVNGVMFTVQERHDPSGRQTTNAYWMYKYFFNILIDIEQMGLLNIKNSDRAKAIKIMKSFYGIQNCPPPLPQKCPPYSQDYLSQDIKEVPPPSPPKVNYALDKVQMSEEAKLRLSLYPERAIMMGIEDAIRYRYTYGKEIRCPERFLGAQIARYAKERPKRKL